LQQGEILFGAEKVLGPSYNLIPGHDEMKLVSQEFYVLENHTVEENIFDKLIGYTNEDKLKRSTKILNLLELVSLRNTRAKHLSSGQKQRVAIARALAVVPQVLLLDEPFSNLDNLLTEKLFSFISKEVKKNNTSVILITHLAEEALKYADSVIVLDNGKVVQHGNKWDVYYKPKNLRLAGLLGGFNIIRSEDFEKTKTKKKTKIFLRPNQLKLSPAKNGIIKLKTVVTNFNGKCFEVLCETKNGKSVLIYSAKPLKPDQEYFFETVS